MYDHFRGDMKWLTVIRSVFASNATHEGQSFAMGVDNLQMEKTYPFTCPLLNPTKWVTRYDNMEDCETGLSSNVLSSSPASSLLLRG